MKKKKWITILSLLLLVVLLAANTPSLLNADGENAGRELQGEDFSSVDVYFASTADGGLYDPKKPKDQQPTEINLWVTGESTLGKQVHFRVEFDLTAISPDETKGEKLKEGRERLKKGDYFYIDLPTELNGIAIPKHLSTLKHPNHPDVVLATLSTEKSDQADKAPRRIKVTFADGVEGPLKNHVSGSVWAKAESNINFFERETRKQTYTISLPGKTKDLKAEYKFENTDGNKEFLLKGGPDIVAYTNSTTKKDYGQVFQYSLRINVRQEPLGTVVVKDGLKDENGTKEFLAGVDYIKDSFELRRLKYKRVTIDGKTGFSTTVEPNTTTRIYSDELFNPKSEKAPSLKLNDDKSFELTIPETGEWTYLLLYKATNPADGRKVVNAASIYEQTLDAENKPVLKQIPVRVDVSKDGKEKDILESVRTGYLKLLAGGSAISKEGLASLTISKVGKDGNQEIPLQGVVLTIVDEKGVEKDLKETSEYGITSTFLEPGTYNIIEKNPPQGYVGLENPVQVVIEKDLNKNSYSVKVVNQAEKKQPQVEKIDVEVTKVCKIDPQNPTAPKTPAAQDQGSDVTLVLERKLDKEGSAFEPVKDSQNNPLEVVLKKDQEKVTFPQVDKKDANGTLYVYRVVEKEVAGQTPSNLEFSTPVVEENKTSIEVTKDCSAPKKDEPKQAEKIDVEVTKVCKVDPQNPNAPKTPAVQDQGSDVTLVLERKLDKDGSAFEPVKDSQNNPLEVVLKKDQEKVTFPQVDKADENSTLYVYRVVEKEVAGQTPSNLEFSTPVVEENKTSIQVTKDCSAPKVEDPKKEEPKLPVTNKPEEPKKEEPSETPSSSEGSGTVSKVERVETPVTSEEKKEEKTPEKPQVGITAEGTVVENNETNVLPGNVPADSSTKTSKNNKAVDPANKKLPKTGEGLNASAYAAIALLGGALLVAYGVFRKKRNQA